MWDNLSCKTVLQNLKPNKMKKVILIAVLSVIVSNVTAQDSDKFIQGINFGGIVSNVVSTSFEESKTPFTFGQNFSGSVTFLTKKTFHNIMYGFGNNSLTSLNGYFLKKNWDVYVVYSRGLSTKSNYAGLGIEKMEKIGNVKFFEFVELGTAFNKKPILSMGLLLNLSWSLKR